MVVSQSAQLVGTWCRCSKTVICTLIGYNTCCRIRCASGLCHKDKIVELNKRLLSTKLFLKVIIWTDPIVKASYVAACLIAKPFTGGEVRYVECGRYNITCFEKRDSSKFSLSHLTITTWSGESGKPTERRLERRVPNFKSPTLALGNSSAWRF